MQTSYKPRDWAEPFRWLLKEVQKILYKVSVRWCFYRVLQKYGLKKTSYKTFDWALSKARKAFWEGWTPGTLVDNSREIILRGFGPQTGREWLENISKEKCVLDKWSTQPEVCLIAFEAKAMYQQFEAYTPAYISLIPFGGELSVSIKSDLAEIIEAIGNNYGKPIKILYFGDLDIKGISIPEHAFRDVRKWCSVPFKVQWVGLTEDQAKKWRLPENPDRPGQYQWEALSDEGAREIIAEGLHQVNLDQDAIKKVEEQEAYATQRFKEIIQEALKNEQG